MSCCLKKSMTSESLMMEWKIATCRVFSVLYVIKLFINSLKGCIYTYIFCFYASVFVICLEFSHFVEFFVSVFYLRLFSPLLLYFSLNSIQ